MLRHFLTPKLPCMRHEEQQNPPMMAKLVVPGCTRWFCGAESGSGGGVGSSSNSSNSNAACKVCLKHAMIFKCKVPGGHCTCNPDAQVELQSCISQTLLAALHSQVLRTVWCFVAAPSSSGAQQPFLRSVTVFHLLCPVKAGSVAAVFKMQSCASPANTVLEYSQKTVLVVMAQS